MDGQDDSNYQEFSLDSYLNQSHEQNENGAEHRMDQSSVDNRIDRYKQIQQIMNRYYPD